MDELNTAPEPQATESADSETLAAAAAEAAAASVTEATDSAAATVPAQESEPDLDAIIERHGKQVVERLRKRRDYAGMLGRDEHNLKREHEERIRAEATQQAYARLKAQEDEARRRREIEEMPDEDYGRFHRERERQDQLRQSLMEDRDRTWVGTLGQFLDDDVRDDYHRPGRWQSMDDYVKAVLEYRLEKELATRTETNVAKLRDEIKQQVFQEMQADRRAAYPGSDVTNGTPVGAKGRPSFTYADEAEHAYRQGQISDYELLQYRATLPYSYVR